jgi:hypothetical protein
MLAGEWVSYGRLFLPDGEEQHDSSIAQNTITVYTPDEVYAMINDLESSPRQ